jgi:hypothetical protein
VIAEIAEKCGKRLVEANLQLVVTLAKRQHNGRVHIRNLNQKGNEGLVQATQSLPDCVPGSFSTHAEKFIERVLIDAEDLRQVWPPEFTREVTMAFSSGCGRTRRPKTPEVAFVARCGLLAISAQTPALLVLSDNGPEVDTGQVPPASFSRCGTPSARIARKVLATFCESRRWRYRCEAVRCGHLPHEFPP